MKHVFVDTYATLQTPIHALNPKTKLILLFVFLLTIIFTPLRHAALLVAYGLMIAFLIYTSKIPAGFILKRIAESLPFVIIVSLTVLFKRQGFLFFFALTLKATLAIVLVLLVSSTTKFSLLLKALDQLKVPRVFILLLSFMYRYTFLLEDQLLRAQRAYSLRNMNNKNNFRTIHALSNILGSLFIRTYERAERVYLAMCARGYSDGESN